MNKREKALRKKIKLKQNKQRRKAARINKRINAKQRESNERIIRSQYIYRYSIAYFNASYHKTFRAEIYTDTEKNETAIQNYLIKSLRDWINLHNRNVKGLFLNSTYLGLESDMVGSNDVGASTLNRVTFHID